MIPYEHKVQYYETDGMGIVHHSNYIRWFEEARVDLLQQLGFGYDRIESESFSSPVLEVHCQYKTMARFGDTVTILAQITGYNGVRMTLHYEIRDAQTDALRCEGESKHCFMGQDGRPVSLRRSWPALDRTFTAQLTPEPTENTSC